MTKRKPNNTITLLDMMMFRASKCRDQIKNMVNEQKVTPTIVMDRELAQKLYDDLNDLGVTVRGHVVYDENGDKVLVATPISVSNYKVTYLKYHPDIIADRTHSGGPYYYKAQVHD